jgi:hypothetical protein
VVETYDGAAKTKERGSGEQKKTLAIRVLNETLPELRVRHIISADLYDQTRMLLVDRESLSGFIDSLIHIWNELQRSGLCAKLFCC